ncbi:MAG: hypothetical protein ACM65M_18710 [Microcoleus sp.]
MCTRWIFCNYELLHAQHSDGGRLHPVPLACGRSFDAFGNLPCFQLLKLLAGGYLGRLTALVLTPVPVVGCTLPVAYDTTHNCCFL